MRKFKYIPHTADIAFIAYGKDLKEAFENSVLAMNGIMFDFKKLSKAKAKSGTITIKEKAKNKEDLIWFGLQSILSMIQTKSLSPISFSTTKLNETGKTLRLEGTLHYKKISPEKYGLLEVKAVTPSGLSITKKAGIIAIEIVVDI